MDDGDGGTSAAQLTITINGTNDSPVAVADVNSVTELADDTTTTNAVTGNVLTNDTDPAGDSDPANFTVTTTGTFTGTYGTLVLSGDGTYSYELDDANAAVQALNSGDTLSEFFPYTMDDGDGGTSAAQLTITINGTNDSPVAVADVNSVTELADDTTTTNAVTGNVLTNDTDPAGDSDPAGFTVTTTGTFTGTYGTLVLNGDGTYSYELDDANAAVQALNSGDTLSESFPYTMDDGDGGTSAAQLTITINGTNDSPVAVADVNAITELADDTTTTNAVTGNVLTNDTDPAADSDPAGFTVTTTGTFTGTYGTLVLNGDGTYSYELDDANAAVQALHQGESLQEVFNYTMNDGDGGLSSSSLTITINGVNDSPIAVDDSRAVNTAFLVATNNTGKTVFASVELDPDATSTYQIVNNNISITPDEMGYDTSGNLWAVDNSTKEFYTIDPQTGNVTFQYVSPALGSGDVDGITFGSAGTEELMYILSGTDILVLDPGDGSLISSSTLNLGGGGASNSLADLISLDGNLYTYSSNGNLFEVTLDGSGNIDQVNNLGNVNISSVYGMVAGDDGLIYLVSSSGNSGEVTAIELDGAGGFSVVDTFDFNNPQGGGNFQALAGQISLETTVNGNVLGNDSDPAEGDSLTVSMLNGEVLGAGLTVDGDYGTLTLNSDGTYTYTLTSSDPGQDFFSYTMSDGYGGLSSATLSFNVNGFLASGGSSTSVGTSLGDSLVGSDDQDIFYGDEGDDSLTGGAGRDQFVFSANGGEGNDVINDFDPAEDVLTLTDVLDSDADSVPDLAELLPGSPQSVSVDVNGADVTLSIAGDNGTTSVTLSGVNSGGAFDVHDGGALQDLVDDNLLQVQYESSSFEG
jgi:VCBS repeat-containing protein